ncbi:hypothetical protein SB49_14150 [Sediminicola sp. YIK13]|nr:hypothetical protein SB49_14150 [Sediminicola sp. YIK13]
MGVRIKGGALQFVLFIGVLIAILLLTFITLGYTHTFFGKKTDALVSTIKKSELGLEYLLKKDIPYNDTIILDLGINDGIDVKAVKEFWGIYHKYTVISNFRKNRFAKLALIGGKVGEQLPSLYVKDNERPMIIVGNSKITGDAFLPKQGIRPGNISGNSYYNNTLIYGRQLESTSQLPELDQNIKVQIADVLNASFLGPNESIVDITNKKYLSTSFGLPTNYIYGEQINLAGVELIGNIIIKATRKIVVNASSKLQDVILVAPEIVIEDHVTGTFQAIASERIVVGEQCALSYPSALVVYDTKESFFGNNQDGLQKPNIDIGSNTFISGVVQYLGESETPKFHPQIKIEKGAKIIGEVYCEQNLELKGQVVGSVTTNNFIAMENGSVYQNHLFNGTINSDLLPKQYVGINYEDSNTTKAVSKWLY